MMQDLISRQAAIDAIVKTRDRQAEKQEYGWEWEYNGFNHAIQALPLPSAQPEVIRCKDCEHWDKTWTNDYAPNYHYCPMIDGSRIGDWYCADAERRTDE